MKNASPALISYLNSLNSNTTLLYAELFTFQLQNGQSYTWTSFDGSILYNSAVFSPMPMDRGKITNDLGFAASGLEITIYNNGSSALSGGYTLAQLVNQRIFDGATVLVQRLYMPTLGDTSLGAVWLFSGIVGKINPSATSVKFTIDDQRSLLNISMPRNVYSPSCGNVLYDSLCQATKTPRYGTVTVSGLTTLTTNLTDVAGFFSLGYLVFTSGKNIHLSANVKQHSAGGVIQMSVALEFQVQVGDTFTIYAGCDKQMSTCSSKFSNLIHFRGQPFIPAPYTAY